MRVVVVRAEQGVVKNKGIWSGSGGYQERESKGVCLR